MRTETCLVITGSTAAWQCVYASQPNSSSITYELSGERSVVGVARVAGQESQFEEWRRCAVKLNVRSGGS